MEIFNKERDDIYLDKIINEKFSSSFMSNKKWVKLITALVDNYSEIIECKVKIIWDDKNDSRLLLVTESLQYDVDFYHNALESMITGYPKGWYSYKEIQWIEFSSVVLNNKLNVLKQDLNKIRSIIEQLGDFRIEQTEEYLRLYAYL